MQIERNVYLNKLIARKQFGKDLSDYMVNPNSEK